jgi:hypothetical protein
VHHPDADDEPGHAPPAGAWLIPGGDQVTGIPGAVVVDLDQAWLLEESVAVYP